VWAVEGLIWNPFGHVAGAVVRPVRYGPALPLRQHGRVHWEALWVQKLWEIVRADASDGLPCGVPGVPPTAVVDSHFRRPLQICQPRLCVYRHPLIYLPRLPLEEGILWQFLAATAREAADDRGIDSGTQNQCTVTAQFMVQC
jgi:hypothetical protein